MTLDPQEMYAAYQSGLSCRSVGSRFGISGSRVHQILHAHGYTLRPVAQDRAIEHGIRGYRRGCKCRVCKKANTLEHNKLLTKGEPPNHGLSGYQNYNCRCPVCTKAGAEAHLRRMAARNARNAQTQRSET